MKILERLRDLAEELKIEPTNFEPNSRMGQLDYDSIEYENPDSLDPLPDFGFSRHTVDGLRRRLPDVHEEIPPEGYEISDQNESFDAG